MKLKINFKTSFGGDPFHKTLVSSYLTLGRCDVRSVAPVFGGIRYLPYTM